MRLKMFSVVWVIALILGCHIPVSPPVSRLLLVSNRDDPGFNDIFIIRENGTGLVNLTPEMNGSRENYPSFSPDGSRIVFCSDVDGDSDIWVMNADGTGKKLVYESNPDVDERTPRWSPDGSQIVFITEDVSGPSPFGDVCIMDPDNPGSLVQVHVGTGMYDIDPRWSPDGSKIALVVSGNEDIFIIRSDGSGAVNISPEKTGPSYDGMPVWSPDGTFVYLSRYISMPPSSNSIWRVNANYPSENIQVTDSAYYASASTISPTNRRIAFSSDRDTPAGYNLQVINTEGSNVRHLTTEFSDTNTFFWSTNGLKIFFNGCNGINYDIYSINANGTGLTNLTKKTADADTFEICGWMAR